MKKILAVILTALLACGSLGPLILRADQPLISRTRGGQRASAVPVPTTPPAITLTTQSAITLTHFDQIKPPGAAAFALGTSHEELAKWLDSISKYFFAYDSQGEVHPIPAGSWALDDVDSHTPGIYSIKRQPIFKDDFDQNYILADGISLPQQLYAISIQIPGWLDINYVAPARGSLRFPWVMSQEQVTQLRKLEELGQDNTFADIWLRKNKQQWTQLKSNYKFAPDAFSLYQSALEEGSTYDLQVDYPGGQTGVVTFEYDSSLNIINYAQGNRDGGDASGNSSSGSFQPAPVVPQKPDNSTAKALDEIPDMASDSNNFLLVNDPLSLSNIKDLYQKIQSIISFYLPEFVPTYSPVPLSNEKQDVPPPIIIENNESTHVVPKVIPKAAEVTSPVQEFYSPEHTIISGLRLHDLCAEEENVVFGSGNLTVSIPSKLLLAQKLSDSDTLSVKLSQLDHKQVLLEISAFEKLITYLPGTVIRLGYIPQSKNMKISVYNPADAVIADASFDGKFLHFKGETPGIYTILETPIKLESTEPIMPKESAQATEPQKASFPLLPLLGALVLATCGMTLFWRKRNG